ncbi:cobQ/CobB/MinD/ParA nucleotide binding domain protein [Synechococcus sp. A18-25c]|uniref:ParA family protein n=1 Tax=Synechococcus sp. A18-25c TaxID=1866938 RepID=UPI0016461692|nr:ParA family protein [Synechococcus sp. A18-25c]QNJ19166.1 cobQ/CobB/MinD/ParA nucleotide binding domain protein [Synechococcus sp. A18-25c]
MFITVFGQKGGVAKTCSSVHIAACWSHQQKRVVLVDADRNRSATAYGARGLLPYPVVPIEAAAKATRSAEIVITDGQASSNEEEMKNLVEGADFILLPTTTQSRSIELTVEMSQMLRQYKIPFAALLVKVDARKEAAAEQAIELFEGFDIKVLATQIPLLSAFEQAETEGVTVDRAIDKRGRANSRRMAGWAAYSAACKEIEGLFEEHHKQYQNHSPIGWDFTPMENRMAA